jgi:Flp pilus assembly protein TadG
MNALRHFWSHDGQGGQAVVLVGISFMALLFAVGLAIDAGQLFVAKRTMQEAADAASFAGSIQLYLGGTQVQARAAAVADATLNGFTDGANGVTVTVNAPPTSGAYLNDALSVEVIIVQQVKTSLVPAEAAFNPVRARSVAQSAPFQSGFAIVSLHPGAGPCITVSSSGGIVVPEASGPPARGGAVQANCTGTAVNLSGSGGINDPIGVYSVGTISNSGRVTGNIIQPAPKQRDPFAGFPKPPASTPYVSNSQLTVPSSACNPATPLQPGVYNGGIVDNQDPATCPNVYLGTGVFVLRGGGLNQNAQNGGTIKVVPGGGAMIFNTHSAYPGTPGTCGDIIASQGGVIDIQSMTAAQSPQYHGMAIYQDAACTNTITIQSNGALNAHGTLYAPSATFQIESQSSGTIDAQIVVDNINIASSGTLTVNYTPSGSAQTSLPSLVE